MLVVRECQESDRSIWNHFVDQQQIGHHAFSWQWRSILSEVFGHRPYYLLVEETSATTTSAGTGIVKGVLPLFYVRSLLFGRSLISVPYINGGGILAVDQQAFQALLKYAQNLAEELGVRYLELRERKVYSAGWTELPFRSHKVAMQLPLVNDPELMFGNFPAKLRSQIRRPTKSGLVAKVVTGGGVSADSYSEKEQEKIISDFYLVFSQNMRDLGTPVYPALLFEKAFKHFSHEANVIVVYQQSVAIAAGITLQNGNAVEIPWASSLRGFNSLSPNMLLYWEAIKTACQKNCLFFDFGRSSPDSGTYRFKEQWGAKPLPLSWYYHVREGGVPDVNPANRKYSTLVACWRRLPLPLANTLGPFLTKGLP